MGCGSTIKGYLAYTTPRIVRFDNWKLGLLHLVIQILIVAYIVVYSIVLQKGYQAVTPIIGSGDIKVKGTAYTLNSSTGDAVVYDAIDLIKPAEQPNAVFITTNLWDTLNQTQSTCASTASSSQCTSDSDCVKNTNTAEGVMTGTCDTSAGQCMLSTWCPIEQEPDNHQTGLIGTGEFTVFIRNNVDFQDFDITKSNIEDNKLEMGFNLFTVEELINMTGFTYDDIQDKGASVALTGKVAQI
jgi:P2X purinoceptor 2